jgi:hypothetical protein
MAHFLVRFTAEECRARAVEADGRAILARDASERRTWQELASTWRQLAEQEQLPLH